MPPDSRSYRYLRIGAALRGFREARGMTQDAASRLLDRSAPSLSAIENGQQALRRRDLTYILDQYGIADPAVREPLLALADQGRQRGWWHTFEQRLDRSTLDFASLEADASSISAFDPYLVHGLLQNEEYARAIINSSGGALRNSRDVEIDVEFRMKRQRVLNKKQPPHLSVVLGEAALRQQIGGPNVMRAQLERLLTAAALPHVTLQVLPFAAGAHPGVDGAFTILDVAPGNLLQVVTVHSLTRSWYVDEPPDVEHYRRVFDRLREIALPEADSLALIERLVSET
jgi:transcriptional regulator with XRE-family HTH domain